MADDPGREIDRETPDEVAGRFTELDEAAAARARERMAAGERPQAAFAQESVMLQMVRAYN
ncbi:MAG: hypothetical protein M3024_08820 [Candidatus Dormibacteraeota bacterium]|nr:hypothetical protein [Candidatus Dormibacteraeota bacterium]